MLHTPMPEEIDGNEMEPWGPCNPGFRCVESIAPAHDDAINALAVSPDGHVYTGSADKKIKAWRRHPERRNKHVLVQTMERHRSAVNALALGADGKVLYSGACDRSVVVWERADGGAGSMEATGTLRGHSQAILCLAAAGDVVCSSSADRTVRVWRRGAENTGYTLPGRPGRPRRACEEPNFGVRT